MIDISKINTKSSEAMDTIALYNSLPEKSPTSVEECIDTVEALGRVRKHKCLLRHVIKKEDE